MNRFLHKLQNKKNSEGGAKYEALYTSLRHV